MATRSCILAWEILWTEEPGGLRSMGLQRIGRNLATKQEQIDFLESTNSCSVHPATFHMACGIFVPWPGIKTSPPALEVQNFNHWTTREVPRLPNLFTFCPICYIIFSLFFSLSRQIAFFPESLKTKLTSCLFYNYFIMFPTNGDHSI